jgi:hypothetical protein
MGWRALIAFPKSMVLEFGIKLCGEDGSSFREYSYICQRSLSIWGNGVGIVVYAEGFHQIKGLLSGTISLRWRKYLDKSK